MQCSDQLISSTPSYGHDMGNVVQTYKAQMQIRRAGQSGYDKIIGIGTMKSMEQHVLDWEMDLGLH